MGCGSSAYKEPRKIPSKHFQNFEAQMPSLQGKVFVITGCTSGAHVVMLNRKSERAKDAEQKLLQEVSGSQVTAVDCDLQSFESVRGAAQILRSMFADDGIDVLCNNAGVMALEDKATIDGYDVQMQTNHLSHFLLTKELFPLLEKGAQLRGEARVVNHSSGARNVPKKDLQAKYLGQNGGNLGGNGSSMLAGGARWQRYQQTKLANVVFTLALDEKLRAANSKVKALAAAPGLAATNLQVTTHSEGGMSETWIMRWAQSAEDGTMPLLCCCTAGVESGDFYEPGGTMRMKGIPQKFQLEPRCTKVESCRMLWEESEKACGDGKRCTDDVVLKWNNMPNGWKQCPSDIAPSVIDKVIKPYQWGTHLLVMEDGKAYRTPSCAAKGEPGGLQMIWESEKGPGRLKLQRLGGSQSYWYGKLFLRTPVPESCRAVLEDILRKLPRCAQWLFVTRLEASLHFPLQLQESSASIPATLEGVHAGTRLRVVGFGECVDRNHSLQLPEKLGCQKLWSSEGASNQALPAARALALGPSICQVQMNLARSPHVQKGSVLLLVPHVLCYVATADFNSTHRRLGPSASHVPAGLLH
ncbi:unnamed protein product [Effrenium voratum]|nr:unnamed protein product [Effrenium voratum]